MSVLEVSRPKIPMFQKIRIFSLFPFFSALCLNMLDAWSKYILSHISFKHIILQVRKINFIFYLWCFNIVQSVVFKNSSKWAKILEFMTNFWWFRWKMNRLNVLEEIVCFTVLLQSGMKLDWSIPFLIAGTVSILNFPDLFPPEDSR